jgi:hypothetical protein
MGKERLFVIVCGAFSFLLYSIGNLKQFLKTKLEETNHEDRNAPFRSHVDVVSWNLCKCTKQFDWSWPGPSSANERSCLATVKGLPKICFVLFRRLV